ncbi:thioredoxin domain-containing protein [Aurantimonas sp. Leaf443]|uniref:thioredoxin domain-containing protein n=1 Tax=Aurantimonas sp. Leaf443 TaxID=1736378 RepID=UPI0006FF46FD|nr:thioredoxin domain-containing protein [Aurantimonas sp. Leaf443]KQT85541.1 hypothetical protein ASG48_10035 [Aurantimonas sp. Leaf443]
MERNEDRNLLGEALSPYLQQHRDNPVHWMEWSPEALARARALDRPILLSIGYAACHWCHVMAHESFENEATAAIANRLFVCIKVDREERPEIDQIYMSALHAMGEQGGWPLTMFLLPTGAPFYGGTYFPPEPRFGRPGFPQVLEAVAEAYANRRDALEKSAADMTAHLHRTLAGASATASLDALALAPFAARVETLIDPVLGGLKGAPKFPNAPTIEVLARSGFPDGPASRREAFLHTLQSLCLGGIYDHLGGGLHRYAVDDRWLVPHFEKMLYDNAAFLRHLAWGARATGERLFVDRLSQTVDWLAREMVVPGGGLAASLDADSLDAEGHLEEGAFYAFAAAEVDAVLGERARAFRAAYDVTESGNFEGSNVLHRLHPAGIDAAADFAPERAQLFQARVARTPPARDDKVLADWSGLAIAGLVEAERVLGDGRALGLARQAFAFVEREMHPNGRLCHAARGGKASSPALSGDYGALMGASAMLFCATLDAAYLEAGHRYAEALERFHGDGAGGHYLSALDATDVPLRLRGDGDDAVPGGTALVVEGLALLAQASGSAELSERALRAAQAAAGRVASGGLHVPALVSAVDRLRRGRELAIFSGPGDPRGEALRAVALDSVDPARLDLFALSPADLPRRLAMAAVQLDGRPAAFLCEAGACRAPVHDADGLRALLLSGSGPD